MTVRVRPCGIERPAHTSRQLLRRVEMEHNEMPGLRLTVAQAGRLFGIEQDVCAQVLDTLVDTSILRRERDGVYVRNARRP
jgi:hypothetical protein